MTEAGTTTLTITGDSGTFQAGDVLTIYNDPELAFWVPRRARKIVMWVARHFDRWRPEQNRITNVDLQTAALSLAPRRSR